MSTQSPDFWVGRLSMGLAVAIKHGNVPRWAHEPLTAYLKDGNPPAAVARMIREELKK